MVFGFSVVSVQLFQRRSPMKIRRLIPHRSVMLSLLMCSLLTLLVACTVNLGTPPPGTPVGGAPEGNSSSPGNASGPSQVTPRTSIPLSHYLIVNSGAVYYAIDVTTGTVIWNLQKSSFTTTPVFVNGQS